MPAASAVVRYEGERTYIGPKVWRIHADGRRSLLERRIVWHSPTGFEWGYAGSGPADLALNLLVDALLEGGARSAPAPDPWCERCRGRGMYRGSRCGGCNGTRVSSQLQRLHHAFKWAYVAGLPEQRWSLEAAEILDWYERSRDLDEVTTA